MVEYKQINHHPCYWVGDDGSVLYRRGGKERPVTPCYNNYGYQYIAVTIDGKRKNLWVAVLALEAFVGPRPAKMQACHNNGVRDDNRLTNLRWGTAKDNADDSFKHGTRVIGSLAPGAKLDNEKVLEICRLIKDGARSVDLAPMFDVDVNTISSIKTGRCWGWLTGVQFGRPIGKPRKSKHTISSHSISVAG